MTTQELIKELENCRKTTRDSMNIQAQLEAKISDANKIIDELLAPFIKNKWEKPTGLVRLKECLSLKVSVVPKITSSEAKE